jgi:cysteinyl-tRNA synthetase
MPLRLHNTLRGSVEPFVPLHAGRVLFYTCGPTVYDYAHIGNFRSFLAADLLRRWLESPLCPRVGPDGTVDGGFGYDVVHVMNITDVGHTVDDTALDGGGEDKMAAAQRRLLEAKKAGTLPEDVAERVDATDPYAIAEYYAQSFMEDGRALGLKVVEDAREHPERMPRPTGVVREMLEMVLTLIDGGHAYIASDGVAYFDTQSFPAYGKLSGNTPEAIRSGAGGRVDAATQAIKKHPADFMLWKPDPHHAMRWDPSELLGRDVPLGEGYPGWHLECSVMAERVLGKVIDLHSGGEDNIFPHHECEIAQSCCAHGTEFFARYWFHPRFLMLEGEKMSKSKGTFFTARDLFDRGFSPAAIRLELIKTHYRSNANFTEQGLSDAGRMVARWRTFLEKADASDAPGTCDDETARAFADAMNDDLNVSGALGVLNGWIGRTTAPTQADAALLRTFDGVLGVLDLEDVAEADGAGEGDAEIDDLVRRRNEARASRDFAEADRIRDELAARNIVITDSPEGTTWSRKATL